MEITPQPSPQPLPNPPGTVRKQVPIILMLLSIVTFMLLLTTAYLGYRNTQLAKQIAGLSNALPTPTPTMQAKGEVPPSIFRQCGALNAETPFTIDYPADWLYSESTTEDHTTYTFTGDTEFLEITCGTGFGGACDPQNQRFVTVGDKKIRACYTNGEWNQIYLMSPDSTNGVHIRSNIADLSRLSQILSTFSFVNQQTTFVCPENGWVDCEPGPDDKPECSEEAMSWYKANCPNFQGGAL